MDHRYRLINTRQSLIPSVNSRSTKIPCGFVLLNSFLDDCRRQEWWMALTTTSLFLIACLVEQVLLMLVWMSFHLGASSRKVENHSVSRLKWWKRHHYLLHSAWLQVQTLTVVTREWTPNTQTHREAGIAWPGNASAGETRVPQKLGVFLINSRTEMRGYCPQLNKDVGLSPTDKQGGGVS